MTGPPGDKGEPGATGATGKYIAAGTPGPAEPPCSSGRRGKQKIPMLYHS